MNARNATPRQPGHIIRGLLRTLLIILAALSAGWATWAIHQAVHPRPALILGVLAAATTAKLLNDVRRHHKDGGAA